MADRLTELQDAINLQAENLCNAIGVIQQVAQPTFFSEFNWASRSTKPEYQAVLQNQSTEVPAAPSPSNFGGRQFCSRPVQYHAKPIGILCGSQLQVPGLRLPVSITE
ncbi:unnamed protein product [Echinostoma caproni]|uniref:Mediator of RNA polymerase II transcription subunit 21 n=1 Tax=Echinostoma caproni TaxID=27848 RepID=A0A183A4L8_9TREM|nr:unnamed protein product [Echinostoma caproni]